MDTKNIREQIYDILNDVETFNIHMMREKYPNIQGDYTGVIGIEAILQLIKGVVEEVTICNLVDIDQTSDFADGMKFQSMESRQRLSQLLGEESGR